MNAINKHIVICMNCHGEYIMENLIKYQHKILEDYQIHHINYAIGKLLTTETFSENDINLIKNADILIIQYIKNNRGMLNHDYIISICNTDKIFLIPHYTFSGYFYDNDITSKILLNCKSKEEIDQTLANISFDRQSCLNFLHNELDNIKNLDMLSCVKMYDFVEKNYKKHRLFQNRGHPNNLFFIELTNQLLNLIGYEKIQYEHDNNSNISWHSNQICVIFSEVKNTLNLEFDCGICSNGVCMSNNEYFYVIMYQYMNNIDTEKINSLCKNIDKKYNMSTAFVHFLVPKMLEQILSEIRKAT